MSLSIVARNTIVLLSHIIVAAKGSIRTISRLPDASTRPHRRQAVAPGIPRLNRTSRSGAV